MKAFLVIALTFAPLIASASQGTGSTIPNLPCYVSGEFIGSMPITECQSINGNVYKNI